MAQHLHLAVALADAGWHPAAWREESARPNELLSARYWTDLVLTAQAGLLDFVTIDDGLGLQRSDPLRPDRRTDQVRGRLDAVLIANRVAPSTAGIGIVPAAIVTHTEPFHLSKSIATLDYVSTGRAGVQLRVNASGADARLFGRRTAPELSPREPASAIVAELFDEAVDYAEVLRRLWDSWEDDAEIRDVATGRFIDRDKLHYIDFEGKHFSVRGPSITPRPPQGQPIISALGHADVAYELIGKAADIGFITPHDPGQASEIVARIRAVQQAAGRSDETPHVFADLFVVLGDTGAAARQRKDRLDNRAGAEFVSDAEVFVGTATGLADRLAELKGDGLSGFRLRPAVLPDDLIAIVEQLVPELQRRGLFRDRYYDDTLRGQLGLSRPVNRYAA